MSTGETRPMSSRQPRPVPGSDPVAPVIARLEAAGRFGIVPGLERTRWLLEQVGGPHLGLRGVLVAGTNGKGSVCALLESMARSAGRPTALLAKPHLVRWGERVVLDGVPIGDAQFAGLADELLDVADGSPSGEHPTQFEILTAMGFLAAARHRAETVICEVGMGGRLDSTNVADLGGCVITNVALDHREWLGDTVEQIALEKAGILKRGDWAVTAATEPARSVIARQAAAVGVPLRILEEDRDWRGSRRGRLGVEMDLSADRYGPTLRCRSPLSGRFQVENLAVAATAAALLGIPEEAIVAGAAAARWPGRLQWVDGTPPLLLDAAHNPAAMAALVPEVGELAEGRRVVALFGAMADKQLGEMLPLLPAMAGEIVLTSIGGGRAAPARELAARLGAGIPLEPVEAALAEARRLAGPSGLVLVCGSLALVGAVLAGLDLA